MYRFWARAALSLFSLIWLEYGEEEEKNNGMGCIDRVMFSNLVLKLPPLPPVFDSFQDVDTEGGRPGRFCHCDVM